MSNSDTARPALRLRRIIDKHRTLREDRSFHLEAHRSFCKLLDRIEDAKWIEQRCGTLQWGGPDVREHRRRLFNAQIADAERSAHLAPCGDALSVRRFSDFARERLEHAIAEYLDATVVSKSRTIEETMALVGWAS